jgi:hypothetical protein
MPRRSVPAACASLTHSPRRKSYQHDDESEWPHGQLACVDGGNWKIMP